MIKINEKYILRSEILIGIKYAIVKFKKINNCLIRQIPVVYIDILEQIKKSVDYYDAFNNEIDVIYLDNKNIDDNILNMFLNLIKSETYKFGLRIIKAPNNDFLYVYIDKVYNNKIYYVDDKKARDDIKKSLGCK